VNSSHTRRPLLLPLVPLYAAGLALKNRLRDTRILKSRSLHRPVLSIGSLSAGGAGKTPVVIALAHLLELHQYRIDVLSRGYGRTSQAIAHVPADLSAPPTLYGDEPVEMTRAGLNVFVGANRHAAGQLAERTQTGAAHLPAVHLPAVHLLDDGFQHRQLARQLDLVLLTAHDVADTLLPAGNLREPLSSLRRAHIVLLREDEAEPLRPIVQKHTTAEIWLIRRDLVIQNQYTRPFVFCGIARPENFLAMLTAAGHPPLGHLFFPDHHPYTDHDITRIVTAAQAVNANGIYCTEKDAVKLSQHSHQRLQTIGPVHSPSLRIQFLNTPTVLQTLKRALKPA
jgi:tetraacyldisaccharide 4'-kinase